MISKRESIKGTGNEKVAIIFVVMPLEEEKYYCN